MSNPDQGSAESDERALTVIPDVNVLIHGKALAELPWAELRRRTIEVLFVPPVIRELDKVKNQSGRPNKIARQLSSDVRALLNAPDHRAEIRKSGPIVTKRVELRRVTTSMHEMLKLDHADQVLINYALHLLADGQNILLLTDDTICGTTAEEVGLPTLLLPDHWLRGPEPDDGAKENAKLKAEVKRLIAAEPKVVLDFHDSAGEPLARLEATITHWPALSSAEIEVLVSEVQQGCPLATSFERLEPPATNTFLKPTPSTLARLAFQPRSVYEPATEKEIECYKTSDYPNWLSSIREALGSLHDNLKARTQWPTVWAFASNVGTRPATDALLGIRAQGALMLLDAESQSDDEEDAGQKVLVPERLSLPLPPAPPRGSVKTIDPLGYHFAAINRAFATAHALPIEMPRFTLPSPMQSDAFYWRTGQRGWVALMELECKSWRHSRGEAVFSLKVRPDHCNDTEGAIELSVHANNISDPPFAQLPIRIIVDEGSTIQEARAMVKQVGLAARANGRF